MAEPSNSWSSEKSRGQFEGMNTRRTRFPVNTVKEALGRRSEDTSISLTTDFTGCTDFFYQPLAN